MYMYQKVRINSLRGGFSPRRIRSRTCQMILRIKQATLTGYVEDPFRKFLISHSRD